MTRLAVFGRLSSSKPERALYPPRLTPMNLARDFIRHIRVYRKTGLDAWTAMGFLVLRLIHHVAYDRGWNGKSE